MTGVVEDWLPPGHCAAVCLSVDDIHPGRSTDHYEAGGDLSRGVLGRMQRLLDRHPQARATLFVTPQWRERSPRPTRSRLARVPIVRERVHLTPPLARAAMRLDRHPAFVEYLRAEPRFELAVHGLFHLAVGPYPPGEFARLGLHDSQRRLSRALAIFADCGLQVERGFCPPGWGFSAALERALVNERFRWVSVACDIETEVSADAKSHGFGLFGVSMLFPQRISQDRLVHLPVNFRATSTDDRALAVLDHGGLLSIKAHAVKDALGHVALDGLDGAYCDRLDRLFMRLEARYGDALWWTTMGGVAARAAAVPAEPTRR